MRRRAAALLALAALLAGCGGGPDAKEVLAQTASRIGRIRSGTLELKLLVTPRGGTARQPFGFELHGPFRLRAGNVPLARVAYTQIANGKRATATLVSTRAGAFAESGGKRVALTPAQADSLRSAAARIQGAAGLARFSIDSWLDHPKAHVDGDEIVVTSGLNVVNAANGLLGLLRLGAGSQITGADAKRLADAVRSSSFHVRTGKKDKLLHEVDLSADIGFDVPPDLKQALGSLVGAKVEFELAVANPNGG